MKRRTAFCLPLVLILASLTQAANYEFEVLIRQGDLVMGSPVSLDTDDDPPNMNSRGDLVFMAENADGNSIFVRSADGSERVVVTRNEYLEGIRIGFDEDGTWSYIDEEGVVRHGECDDIGYSAIERDIISFGPRIIEGRNMSMCGPGFLTENGEYQFNAFSSYGWSVIAGDEVVLGEGDTFAGLEVLEAQVFHSPHGTHIGRWIRFPDNNGEKGTAIFVNDELRFKSGEPFDGFVASGASPKGINDSGELAYTTGDRNTANSLGTYIDGELILPETTTWGERAIVNILAQSQITSDGNLMGAVSFVGGGTGITFNDQLILHNGFEVPGEATLASLNGFSFNPRGDIVFIGRFDDGVNRIVLARRLDPEHGDFNDNGQFDVTDINRLDAAIAKGVPDERYDMANDGQLDLADRQYWIFQIANSTYGDSNLDGTFNSQDLVITFQAGEYEDSLVRNSNWSDGDWNGDGEFTSSDLVLAFAAGGYEASATFVPEPNSVGMLLLAITGWATRMRVNYFFKRHKQ
ncbi:MAG: PEP-CTERM sorting domain-containing protein [Pirellulaceae bacterium]